MSSVQYVEIDSTSPVSGLIDSNNITIEGADVASRAIKNPAIKVQDYLGIGTPGDRQ